MLPLFIDLLEMSLDDEEGSTVVDRDRWRIALPSLSLNMASEHSSYRH